ncbi:MAG: hypothetical protein M1829_002572 [Trizodia sp. TS-e1964]|nr:MAG: hypothetical protein M1829_002572 [Trizodia sp. TS-e1964]
MSPTLKKNLGYVLKGALTQATSGALYLEDLTDIQDEKMKRAARNSGLQRQIKNSGHMYTSDAKRFKANREEQELKKAQTAVDRAEHNKAQFERKIIEERHQELKKAVRDYKARQKYKKQLGVFICRAIKTVRPRVD